MVEATCTVRSLGLRLLNDAPAGSEEYRDGEEAKAEIYEAANRYLSKFAATEPADGNFLASGPRCPCGSHLGGFLGTFTWGIVHGEGFCSLCKHPARGVHYIANAEGEEILQLTIPLPYARAALHGEGEPDDEG